MLTKKRLKKYFIDAIVSVKKEIEEEIATDKFPRKSVNELANEAGIGRNALQTGFKEVYGASIKEYMLRIRIEKARKMLEEDEKTIKQIAAVCGYRSQSNFTAAFKKVYDKTPTEFQQQFRDIVSSN